jgi:hypothetical protein
MSTTVLPRWRFWRWGFIFKSDHSPHNNLMVVLRNYKWDCRTKRWGIEITRYSPKSYPEGTRMIVLGASSRFAISIHITPNRPVQT